MSTPTRVIAHHTLCELDLTHPLIAQALLDPHDMHRLVMRPFHHWVPDGAPDPRAQMGILHTYAVNLAANTLTLIVQSRVPGDWHALPARAKTTAPSTQTIDLTIHEGQTFRFRTVINPARYAPTPAGPRTRSRPADASPAKALEWFTSRLQPHATPAFDRWPRIGADTDPTTLKAKALVALTSARRPGIRINRAEVQGQLTVTDPQAFATTLTQGLGRSRPYGCGLMLTKTLQITKEQSRDETQAQEASRPHARV
ncbi:type I-E CRISPR-associated protein Cas6/Cse3/CasE [Streptomyces sp. NPDC046925]|uniref:type I-E CRISPR-associated protein Cas6/Cse3/CasE n=1 Tax=Streptomyces sp. NPDC046925 TaxID=3155375 RepID=UPI0033C1A486